MRLEPIGQCDGTVVVAQLPFRARRIRLMRAIRKLRPASAMARLALNHAATDDDQIIDRVPRHPAITASSRRQTWARRDSVLHSSSVTSTSSSMRIPDTCHFLATPLHPWGYTMGSTVSTMPRSSRRQCPSTCSHRHHAHPCPANDPSGGRSGCGFLSGLWPGVPRIRPSLSSPLVNPHRGLRGRSSDCRRAPCRSQRPAPRAPIHKECVAAR